MKYATVATTKYIWQYAMNVIKFLKNAIMIVLNMMVRIILIVDFYVGIVLKKSDYFRLAFFFFVISKRETKLWLKINKKVMKQSVNNINDIININIQNNNNIISIKNRCESERCFHNRANCNRLFAIQESTVCKSTSLNVFNASSRGNSPACKKLVCKYRISNNSICIDCFGIDTNINEKCSRCNDKIYLAICNGCNKILKKCGFACPKHDETFCGGIKYICVDCKK